MSTHVVPGERGGLTTEGNSVHFQNNNSMPEVVDVPAAGLQGAVLPSIGDLGPFLKSLVVQGNPVTSIPANIGVLTSMTAL